MLPILKGNQQAPEQQALKAVARCKALCRAFKVQGTASTALPCGSVVCAAAAAAPPRSSPLAPWLGLSPATQQHYEDFSHLFRAQWESDHALATVSQAQIKNSAVISAPKFRLLFLSRAIQKTPSPGPIFVERDGLADLRFMNG